MSPHPPPLINGQDLIALGWRPGPKFKEVLDAVQTRQLEGSLNSREEPWIGSNKNTPEFVMALRNSKIHVARSGAILGAYDRDKIGDFWIPATSGDRSLLRRCHRRVDSSLCPGDAREAASGEFKPSDKREESEEITDESAKSSSRSSRRGSGSSSSKSKAKAKKGATITLAGWLACLVALIVAICIWAYAQLLRRFESLRGSAAALKEQVDSLKRENQLISEITPPGHVRAVITYAPTEARLPS